MDVISSSRIVDLIEIWEDCQSFNIEHVQNVIITNTILIDMASPLVNKASIGAHCEGFEKLLLNRPLEELSEKSEIVCLPRAETAAGCARIYH
jgi:hypothetical protein